MTTISANYKFKYKNSIIESRYIFNNFNYNT